MCQHNKPRVVASSRHNKVGDIDCLAPGPSGGDRTPPNTHPGGEREQKQGDGETTELEKKVMAKSIERESNDGKRIRQGRQRSWRHSVRGRREEEEETAERGGKSR